MLDAVLISSEELERMKSELARLRSAPRIRVTAEEKPNANWVLAWDTHSELWGSYADWMIIENKDLIHPLDVPPRKAGEVTTSIRITLPIAPGAKTCERCSHQVDLGFGGGDYCEAFRKVLPLDDSRLPECIAGERIKTSDSWEVQCVGGHRATGYTRKEFAVAFIQHYMTGQLEGAKLVHVTRYRRPKCAP